MNSTQYRIQKASNFAEIWQCELTGQKSLHSLLFFKPGEKICSFKFAQNLPKPTYLTVQANEGEHLLFEPFFLHYINHSCAPNVFFDFDKLELICIKHIQIQEEFVFFYPSTEWEMIQPFKCKCQSQQCLDTIKGAAYLSSEILQEYKLSKYIQKNLKER